MNPATETIATSASISRKQRFGLACVLGSMTAIGPLSIDMYLPSLPILAADLKTTASFAQLTLTAFMLGIALGQLLMGPLSDAHGRRKPLIASLVVYALSSFLCAFIPSIWGLVFLRFVQGVAGAGGIVIARAMVRDLYDGPELTKFFSLLMLINGLAPILAPVAGGQLLKFTTWNGVFVVLGALGILLIAGAVFGLKETLPSSMRASGGVKQTVSTFGLLLKDRVFVGYMLSMGLVSASMFAYISGSPFVLQDIYGVSPQGFSMFFAINGLGLIIATQITGRLAGRYTERSLFTAGLIISLVSCLALLIVVLLHAPLPAVLIPLFIAVSSTGVVNTAGFSLAMGNQKKRAGSASALLGLLPFISGSIVAPLVGIGGGTTAVPMGIVIASCSLLASLFYVTLARLSASGQEIEAA
ncbi:multidrug effflux MFS transporter [Paenibacillus aquistagni]|uniref:Bcr/CflA family efflux transporter n=1 Tax=Paenibacillus aquistagni TaxID=1852522 RepID=A0A1X7KR80_9BACL|nr:multidrug effflux MFS transporter [Paenibacillus aquistagni]SMG43656.1 MFS transporter, DHA1 family, bicyclomycin/chloramphenicol resistance protein [Paenibacillus aquistagni]